MQHPLQARTAVQTAIGISLLRDLFTFNQLMEQANAAIRGLRDKAGVKGYNERYRFVSASPCVPREPQI